MIDIQILQELQNKIDTEIQPAKNMQFKIQTYDGNYLQVGAPLTGNKNHHGTAFGGSLYSIAAVAGWALLRCKLHEYKLSGTIVVSKASMQYHAPVTKNFSISVCLTDPFRLQTSMQYYTENKSARFEVFGIIKQDDKEAARYEGSYSIKDFSY